MHSKLFIFGWNAILLSMGMALVAVPASAQVIERVSIASDGSENDERSYAASISENGRYVVFVSETDALVPDGIVFEDVYLRDRLLGTTEQVSLNASGMQPDDYSYEPWVSQFGRYVVFISDATDMVAGDVEGQNDVFLRDLQLGTTQRISETPAGVGGNGGSNDPTASRDVNRIVFESFASNLVAGDNNGVSDIFLWDSVADTISRVSVATGGAEADARSIRAEISADGRYVVFESSATNLVPDDSNGFDDVFLHDPDTGITERISVSSSGQQGVGGRSNGASISAEGRYVAFYSFATNLVANDTNGAGDVFVRDRLSGTTQRVSVSSSGAQGNGSSGGGTGITISKDGRVVVFSSSASNLVANDTNAATDVFVHDRVAGITRRVSVNQNGDQHNALTVSIDAHSISANGDLVVFRTSASNLVAGDMNGLDDIFVAEYPAVDLVMDKTSGAVFAQPGATINYMLLIENQGVSSADGALVVDNPPMELENVTWTCTELTGGFCGANNGVNFINESVTLNAGGSLVYMLTGTVPTNWTDPITNTASITAPASRLELDPANNTDSDTDIVGLFVDSLESEEP